MFEDAAISFRIVILYRLKIFARKWLHFLQSNVSLYCQAYNKFINIFKMLNNQLSKLNHIFFYI